MINRQKDILKINHYMNITIISQWKENLLLDHTTNESLVLVSENGTYVPVIPSECQPRWTKTKEDKKKRTKSKAEVFTPLWVTNKMIDALEEQYKDSLNWKEYIQKTYLEMCCGEAPFLVHLYEPESGVPTPFLERKGILDRKLNKIPEGLSDHEWEYWASEALKSVFGCEWQGDSLFIARQNILIDFLEHYQNRLNKEPSEDYLNKVLNIITWNIFQMDALTGFLPKTEIPVKIMDWKENKIIHFNEIKK